MCGAVKRTIDRSKSIGIQFIHLPDRGFYLNAQTGDIFDKTTGEPRDARISMSEATGKVWEEYFPAVAAKQAPKLKPTELNKLYLFEDVDGELYVTRTREEAGQWVDPDGNEIGPFSPAIVVFTKRPEQYDQELGYSVAPDTALATRKALGF